MECAYTSRCPLYAVFQIKPILEMWKNKYCKLDPEKCHRYKGIAKGELIPSNMLPNGELLKYSLER